MRLIGADNEQVGIVDTDRAREMAKEAGLDLVEVAPNVRPPVCRIMDYGKWKYQQKKKEQKARSHAKQAEVKEVRLRPGTEEHDVKLKLDRARDFLAEGHKVQFTMMFKGRQMAHRDIGFEQLKQVAEDFADVAKVENAPRAMGRRMTMLVAPLSKVDRKEKEKEKEKEKQVDQPADLPDRKGGESAGAGPSSEPDPSPAADRAARRTARADTRTQQESNA